MKGLILEGRNLKAMGLNPSKIIQLEQSSKDAIQHTIYLILIFNEINNAGILYFPALNKLDIFKTGLKPCPIKFSHFQRPYFPVIKKSFLI